MAGLAALLVATACASAPTTCKRLIVQAAPPQVFTCAVRLVATVHGPDGVVHEVSGEASAGSTTRALCALLHHSLLYYGCEAKVEDFATGADALEAAMQQKVALPAGWVFTAVRGERLGSEGPALVVTCEGVR